MNRPPMWRTHKAFPATGHWYLILEQRIGVPDQYRWLSSKTLSSHVRRDYHTEWVSAEEAVALFAMSQLIGEPVWWPEHEV